MPAAYPNYVPQTYATLTNAQRSAYNMVLLERAYPYTPMFADAVKASIAEHQGTTMEWRIYGGANVGVDAPSPAGSVTWAANTGGGLALATGSLTEGVPPGASAVTVTKKTKAVLQYGAFASLSDLMVHQGIDPIWTEVYELLGEQAGQTLHTLLINDLSGGTNIQYASTVTTRVTVTNTMKISSTEIREAVRTLRKLKVPTFADGFYHGLMSPDTEFDVLNDADWKTISQYNGGTAAGSNSMIKSAVGDFLGVRWLTSTDAPVYAGLGAGGIDVHGTFVYGPRWYGTVDLAAYPTPGIDPKNQRGIKVTGVPVDTETKDDPLGQFGIAGWKTSYGGLVLQNFRGIRIEHAVT